MIVVPGSIPNMIFSEATQSKTFITLATHGSPLQQI